MKPLTIAISPVHVGQVLQYSTDIPISVKKSFVQQVLLMDSWIKHLHADTSEICVEIHSVIWDGQVMTARVISHIDNLLPALDIKLLGFQSANKLTAVTLVLEEIKNV